MTWKPIHLLPALLLAGCILFVQWQGWGYWNRHVDPQVGWLGEVILEGVCLAFWFLAARARRGFFGGLARTGWAVLGVVATVALLAGPVHQTVGKMAGEAWAEYQDYRNAPALLPLLRRRLPEAVEKAAYYRELARVRVGWQTQLDAAEAREREIRERTARLEEVRVTYAPPWGGLFQAGLLALALLLAQVCNAALVYHLAGYREAPPTVSASVSTAPRKTETEAEMKRQPETRLEMKRPAEMKRPPETAFRTETPPARPAPVGYDDLAVKRLIRVVRSEIECTGLSLTKWCEAQGVNPRDISFLGNHFKRLAQGQPTISAPKLADLMNRYLPPSELEFPAGV